jgi:hypothetical protein
MSTGQKGPEREGRRRALSVTSSGLRSGTPIERRNSAWDDHGAFVLNLRVERARSGRFQPFWAESLPCRRSWVRVPSSAPNESPAPAGFSLVCGTQCRDEKGGLVTPEVTVEAPSLAARSRRGPRSSVRCRQRRIGPGCGTIKLLWNGVQLRQVSLAHATTQRKQLVARVTLAASESGDVAVVVATSGSPVEIDGLAVGAA